MSDVCKDKGVEMPAWEGQIFAFTEWRLISRFRFWPQVLLSELEQGVTSCNLRTIEPLSLLIIKYFNK